MLCFAILDLLIDHNDGAVVELRMMKLTFVFLLVCTGRLLIDLVVVAAMAFSSFDTNRVANLPW